MKFTPSGEMTGGGDGVSPAHTISRYLAAPISYHFGAVPDLSMSIRLRLLACSELLAGSNFPASMTTSEVRGMLEERRNDGYGLKIRTKLTTL